MLNKELLMAGITMKEPHILLTVGRYAMPSGEFTIVQYGYKAYKVSSNATRIPCWGGYGTIKNYVALKTLLTDEESGATIIAWRNPFTPNRLEVTRLDTGKSIHFSHTEPSVSQIITDAQFFTESAVGREIPVIFDPPPTIIWIPLRANRSRKRVLCRRRPLGGSRC